MEEVNTILILHKPCYMFSDTLLRWLATSVELLSTIYLMCRATCTVCSRMCVPWHDEHPRKTGQQVVDRVL